MIKKLMIACAAVALASTLHAQIIDQPRFLGPYPPPLPGAWFNPVVFVAGAVGAPVQLSDVLLGADSTWYRVKGWWHFFPENYPSPPFGEVQLHDDDGSVHHGTSWIELVTPYDGDPPADGTGRDSYVIYRVEDSNHPGPAGWIYFRIVIGPRPPGSTAGAQP